MHEKFVTPVTESLIQTMTMMAKMEIKADQAIEKKDSQAKGDMTGIMTLSSSSNKLSIAITFTEELMGHIAEIMLPPNSPKSRSTCLDLLGEITNIVAGGVKQRLNKLDPDLQLSLPVIIYGKDHTISHKSVGPVLLIPFNCDAGGFNVELCYEPPST